MAQIIKQRRGSITQLKDVTARISELVVATGSIGNLNGPFLFVGETEGVAGAYRPVSKIYQGAAAPTITVGSYGSVLDGTPFYASGNKSLYILSQAGNSKIDLTGNIEGNTISGVTINSLTGSNADITSITGSISGSNGKFLNLTGVTFTSTNSNITALTSSNAYVGTLTGGTLNVTGTTRLDGDLYISGNIIQTGSIDLTGNVTLGGNIFIGNQTSDLVVFQGEVSSSILPEVNNAFDLGAPSQAWRDLHVSGTANVGTLNAGTISLSGITVFQDLVVSGSSFLGQGGGDNVVVSGSIYNDALTEKRLVVAGTNGLLTNYSGLTFDNGNLNLSGALEVTNIQGTGSLYLKPDLNDSRLFEIYNSAGPSGYTDIHLVGNADLNFFGDDTNYLKIDNYAQTATLVGVNGVIISSSLQVTGSIYNDQLTDNRVLVAGPNGLVGDSQYLTYDEVTLRAGAFEVDIMSGDTRMSGSLLVKGGATVTGSFNLSGSANVAGPLDVKGDTTLTGSLIVKSGTTVTGSLDVTGSLGVSGSAQFSSTINVDGVATVSSSVVEDLTQNRIVGVGAGGALVDYSGLTYNGTVLQIGGGQFEVDNADGDIRTSGSLTANGFTSNGDLTVNGVLTVTGNTQLGANLYVSGNLEVLGTATNVSLQSSTVEIGDNIILVNAYSPFQQYAGLAAYDSGSGGASGSLLWDSLRDYWMFVSSSGQSSKIIGTTAGTYGSENSLTSGTFPIATSNNTIGDSLLTYSGTTLALNTNKFTINSDNGDTLVSGNFTLSYSGGTDTNSNTSAIMFRNSNNLVGFVSTTETEDVLDGILGYKNSNGGLVFSTVIDGGTY
jgi:cytoskeletal protein CcmA (bactofilin family)